VRQDRPLRHHTVHGIPKDAIRCSLRCIQHPPEGRPPCALSLWCIQEKLWRGKHRGPSQIPLHGIGQGNGAGLAIWAVISTILLNTLVEDNLAATFTSPLSPKLSLPSLRGAGLMTVICLVQLSNLGNEERIASTEPSNKWTTGRAC
jgi:hypothetical protein